MATMTSQTDLKRIAGEEAAKDVRTGSVVGLGTGSTVEWTVKALGRRIVEEGLDIVGVPTSVRTEALARELGIPLTTLDENPRLDVTIDGADEVDPFFDLVKGGGGALTREKVVARASAREVIVVDKSKLVRRLGDAFPLPVEVLPLAVTTARMEIETLGAEVRRRMSPGGAHPYVTDNGLAILDCRFPGGIAKKAETERDINLIPGVLENGLFLGLCQEVIVGTPEGARRLTRGDRMFPQ